MPIRGKLDMSGFSSLTRDCAEAPHWAICPTPNTQLAISTTHEHEFWLILAYPESGVGYAATAITRQGRNAFEHLLLDEVIYHDVRISGGAEYAISGNFTL
jgi:hypothetical protein